MNSKHPFRRFASLPLLAGVVLAIPLTARAENWPRFRGPLGTGHSIETDVPVQWDVEAVRYRVELPGRGQSSPVTWGPHVFLTSAGEDGDERHVMCLKRSDGSLVWKQTVKSPLVQPVHRMNSWATATCATDGKYVYAFFGEAGLHCFDVNGRKIWSQMLGEFPGPWGNASSPIRDGDAVIQNCDALGSSYLIALHRKTGAQIWRTPRVDKPRGGWTTPILIDTGQRRELIVNGEYGVRGYDPATGEELWFCKGFNGRGTPAPAWGLGMLFVVNGKPGDVYAVRPGGAGDVSETHMAWHAPRRGGRDLPSPVLVGDKLFVVSMGGVASMYDAKTGKTLWTERLEGEYSGSPVAAEGLIYVQNEAGAVFVIEPADALKIVARNPLNAERGEIFRSSPAISDGEFFFRSDRALYRVGSKISR